MYTNSVPVFCRSLLTYFGTKSDWSPRKPPSLFNIDTEQYMESSSRDCKRAAGRRIPKIVFLKDTKIGNEVLKQWFDTETDADDTQEQTGIADITTRCNKPKHCDGCAQ